MSCFHLGLILVFDVSVSNQTGCRLDMISCLETLFTFFARRRLFLSDWFLLLNFGNFLFLAFLLRLRDWPKSEENRDEFIWWWIPSIIWCDFGGWNGSSVHPKLLNVADDWAQLLQCCMESAHEWSEESWSSDDRYNASCCCTMGLHWLLTSLSTNHKKSGPKHSQLQLRMGIHP